MSNEQHDRIVRLIEDIGRLERELTDTQSERDAAQGESDNFERTIDGLNDRISILESALSEIEVTARRAQ